MNFDRIQNFKIISNNKIAKDTYEMILSGNTSWIKRPGQFINITIKDRYLKRPISISSYTNDSMTIIYKVVGYGTEQLSRLSCNEIIECLVDLGNGFDININEEHVLLVGGGVGVPPLYGLAKSLLIAEKKVTVVLGFASKDDSFYIDKFLDLGCDVFVSTNDGTLGSKGFVTDVILNNSLNNLYYYSCGPEVMLKALHKTMQSKGQLSFEARMGCGFGACMGCSCKTITGYKRICKEGPVMESEDIIWED